MQVDKCHARVIIIGIKLASWASEQTRTGHPS